MNAAVIALVVVGIAFVLAVSTQVADAATLTIAGFVIATGALAIAVVRRSRSGTVAPATCRECGGLISPNAPYCKHCGAQI